MQLPLRRAIHLRPRFSLRWISFLLVLFCSRALFAQAPAGGLRGSVSDLDFGATLSEVTVRLEGTSFATRTDADGRYFFPNLPPGRYKVQAARDGFKLREAREVSVGPGRVSETSLEMIGEVVELEEFIVEADDLLGSEVTTLLDIRASLATFTDSIGADFISKVGGTDAGDVVKRIVGTSVADSRYVVIRGLSDRYNSVLLNSARVPSSDPDRRAVNIDIFPSSLIGELTNSKTFTPNIPGESTGGSINIVTKSAPAKPFLNFSFSTGYNTQATGNENYVSYQGSGTGVLGTANERRIPVELRNFTSKTLPTFPQTPELIANATRAARLLDPTTGTTTKAPPDDFGFGLSLGTRIENFMGGPLGILAAFTYSKKFEFDPDVQRGEIIIAGEGSRVLNEDFQSQEGGESLLSGLLLSAGWEATPNDRIKLTLFANVAAEDRAFFQKGLAVGSTDEEPGAISPDDAASIIVSEGIQYVERRLQTLQATGSHIFPGLNEAIVDWGFTYSQSSQNEPDGRFSSALFRRSDQVFVPVPDRAIPALQRYFRRLDDSSYSVALNLKIPLFSSNSGKELTFLRMGGLLDYSSRDARADTFGYDASSIFSADPLPGKLGPNNAEGTTAADLVGRRGLLTRERDAEVYEASQAIVAGYANVEFNVAEKFRATVGLRAETTDIRVFRDPGDFISPTGNIEEVNGPATGVFDTSRLFEFDQLGRTDIEEVNVLPAMNATWDFHDNMKARFAATRTVARPSFKELALIFIDDPLTGSRFRGNSELQTSSIDNVDVRLEWFPNPGDVIAASFFTKYIERPIELFTSPKNDFFANQDNAIIYGYEFEIQKNLKTLADELRDFSLGFNFTKIFSQVNLIEVARMDREAAGLDPQRRLQGQPDYLLNFSFAYNNVERGFYAGLFLNVTGETLFQAGSSSGDLGFAADVFQQPITSLDFTISQKLSESWKANFRAENLINDDVIRLSEGETVYSKSSGTKYSFSLSASF